MGIDYVEASSAWFTDENQAAKVRARLRAAGLATLPVSNSPFYNARIPFSRVRGVIAAYLIHCDLCTEIRRFLFHRESGFTELAPAGFYA